MQAADLYVWHTQGNGFGYSCSPQRKTWPRVGIHIPGYHCDHTTIPSCRRNAFHPVRALLPSVCIFLSIQTSLCLSLMHPENTFPVMEFGEPNGIRWTCYISGLNGGHCFLSVLFHWDKAQQRPEYSVHDKIYLCFSANSNYYFAIVNSNSLSPHPLKPTFTLTTFLIFGIGIDIGN